MLALMRAGHAVPAGQAARNALMRQADERMREQLKRDNAEFLSRYGINEEQPDPEAVSDPIPPVPASALPFPSLPDGCSAAAGGRRRC